MTRDPIGTKEPLLVVVNPRAGRGVARRRAEQVVAELQRAGLPFVVATTTGPGHAESLAAGALGAVVAVGGDGTVHEVVNGLPARDGHLGPFAVLPAGSGDDFAANAGFTRDPRALVERLLRGTTRAIDVGIAEIDCEHGSRRRRFVNDAGLGFEAEVVLAAARTPWLRGLPLYLAATMRAVRRQRIVDCDLTYEQAHASVRERLPILFASACNGPRVGGGLHFAPDASIDDRALDVLRVTAGGRTATLSLLAKLVWRRHHRDARVRLERCTAVVMTPASPLPVSADGELLAHRAVRLRASVLAERLLVVD